MATVYAHTNMTPKGSQDRRHQRHLQKVANRKPLKGGLNIPTIRRAKKPFFHLPANKISIPVTTNRNEQIDMILEDRVSIAVTGRYLVYCNRIGRRDTRSRRLVRRFLKQELKFKKGVK